MTASELITQADGAGVAAGQTVLTALTVCESLALHAIGDPVQRNGAVLQTRRLRARAGEALEASANAYVRARRELDVSLDETNAPGTGRDAALHRALTDALDGLIALAEAGVDAALMAAGLAELVEPGRRPDAAGVAELAVGAVRCVRHLIEVNLALTRADPRRQQIAELASAAEQAAVTARQVLTQG
jgi:hypothetical protein